MVVTMKKIHYSWVIVGVSCVIIAMTYGIINNCFFLSFHKCGIKMSHRIVFAKIIIS